MTDPYASTQAVADESVQPTDAAAVTDPSMVPMDDATGGPTASKEQLEEPNDEEASTQLSDFG